MIERLGVLAGPCHFGPADFSVSHNYFCIPPVKLKMRHDAVEGMMLAPLWSGPVWSGAVWCGEVRIHERRGDPREHPAPLQRAAIARGDVKPILLVRSTAARLSCHAHDRRLAGGHQSTKEGEVPMPLTLPSSGALRGRMTLGSSEEARVAGRAVCCRASENNVSKERCGTRNAKRICGQA